MRVDSVQLGLRFLERRQPSLEAQVANIADEITYNNHDVDDGLRSGLLEISELQDVTLFARHHAEVESPIPLIAVAGGRSTRSFGE
jgi:dGTPase